jgi:hypothetical protein
MTHPTKPLRLLDDDHLARSQQPHRTRHARHRIEHLGAHRRPQFRALRRL